MWFTCYGKQYLYSILVSQIHLQERQTCSQFSFSLNIQNIKIGLYIFSSFFSSSDFCQSCWQDLNKTTKFKETLLFQSYWLHTEVA